MKGRTPEKCDGYTIRRSEACRSRTGRSRNRTLPTARSGGAMIHARVIVSIEKNGISVTFNSPAKQVMVKALSRWELIFAPGLRAPETRLHLRKCEPNAVSVFAVFRGNAPAAPNATGGTRTARPSLFGRRWPRFWSASARRLSSIASSQPKPPTPQLPARRRSGKQCATCSILAERTPDGARPSPHRQPPRTHASASSLVRSVPSS
jgi:hypothetical protein